ncbi:rRNA maturation RNase YbeY [bacterium]|nr:rRNA maturation RNase YbeY [bacterium]
MAHLLEAMAIPADRANMAPSFTISNRQRKHDLRELDLVSMTSRLGQEVCRNLKETPCSWISSDVLAAIERQGVFNLVFVSDRKIRELNKQWRGKDQATDVLSFPLDLEPDFDFVDTGEACFEVGEVIVSVDKAIAQAEEYGHSLEREVAFLVTHGILHVLGFDHETSEDEAEMFGRQRKILSSGGYIRR